MAFGSQNPAPPEADAVQEPEEIDDEESQHEPDRDGTRARRLPLVEDLVTDRRDGDDAEEDAEVVPGPVRDDVESSQHRASIAIGPVY